MFTGPNKVKCGGVLQNLSSNSKSPFEEHFSRDIIDCIGPLPKIKNRKGLMRFLGMADYYWKFNKNFSDMAIPMTEFVKEDQKYHWTSNCQHAFDNIKSLLCSVPVLVALDYCKPFVLSVDACDTGVVGILLMMREQNIWCVTFQKVQ